MPFTPTQSYDYFSKSFYWRVIWLIKKPRNQRGFNQPFTNHVSLINTKAIVYRTIIIRRPGFHHSGHIWLHQILDSYNL